MKNHFPAHELEIFSCKYELYQMASLIASRISKETRVEISIQTSWETGRTYMRATSPDRSGFTRKDYSLLKAKAKLYAAELKLYFE